MIKHEWRKAEKSFYFPGTKPETITIPEFNFITIDGEGNPNKAHFSDNIGVLYSVSYAIKMTLKKAANNPKAYNDYTVYPLEGIWDLNAKAKENFDGTINKDDFVFKLMIRQPDFISTSFFREMLTFTKLKKPHPLLDKIKFEAIRDGKCIQMQHIGSFDDEPKSFELMEAFGESQNLTRISKVHREIYLSDFRKVPSEKLKTVLRFKVQ